MNPLPTPPPTPSTTPAEFIETIRKSYVHAETVYTNGACYQFHLILKQVWPNAVPWYDSIVGHGLTEIEGRYYDITGEVNLPLKSYPLAQEPRILEEAKTWKFDWGLHVTDYYD